MLLRLEIFDLAVISHAVFEPGKGLNVISGETGAGKSLLIDALGLIMGHKASKDVIRTGSESTFVEALFDVSDINDETFKNIISDNGIDISDGQLIISRKISQEGRSITRINGRTVILSLLKDIASFLLDIHGQNDTQSIFDEKHHIKLLDAFGSVSIEPLYKEYVSALNDYKKIVLQIKDIAKSPAELASRKNYLEYALNEINEAGLHDGEEEELQERKKELLRNERIGTIIASICQLFDGDDFSITSAMSEIADSSVSLSKENNAYSELSERITSLKYELESVSDEVSGISDSIDFDASELSRVNSRIGLIYDLKSKYGKNVAEILAFASKASDELGRFSNTEEQLKILKEERLEKEKILLSASDRLSAERHKAAESLSTAITTELEDLEMPNCRFQVSFRRRPKEKYFSSNGTEDIVFEFSSNKGEDLKSLASTASGGEASRIMLAIKTVLSAVDSIPTLIFDEIDTGISGNASVAIAFKLKSISESHQVLCVSHTAQIAAAANSNYFLSKNISGERTETEISILDENGKIAEVSRLLSGISSTESIQLSKKLIAGFVR